MEPQQYQPKKIIQMVKKNDMVKRQRKTKNLKKSQQMESQDQKIYQQSEVCNQNKNLQHENNLLGSNISKIQSQEYEMQEQYYETKKRRKNKYDLKKYIGHNQNIPKLKEKLATRKDNNKMVDQTKRQKLKSKKQQKKKNKLNYQDCFQKLIQEIKIETNLNKQHKIALELQNCTKNLLPLFNQTQCIPYQLKEINNSLMSSIKFFQNEKVMNNRSNKSEDHQQKVLNYQQQQSEQNCKKDESIQNQQISSQQQSNQSYEHWSEYEQIRYAICLQYYRRLNSKQSFKTQLINNTSQQSSSNPILQSSKQCNFQLLWSYYQIMAAFISIDNINVRSCGSLFDFYKNLIQYLQNINKIIWVIFNQYDVSQQFIQQKIKQYHIFQQKWKKQKQKGRIKSLSKQQLIYQEKQHFNGKIQIQISKEDIRAMSKECQYQKDLHNMFKNQIYFALFQQQDKKIPSIGLKVQVEEQKLNNQNTNETKMIVQQKKQFI